MSYSRRGNIKSRVPYERHRPILSCCPYLSQYLFPQCMLGGLVMGWGGRAKVRTGPSCYDLLHSFQTICPALLQSVLTQNRNGRKSSLVLANFTLESPRHETKQHGDFGLQHDSSANKTFCKETFKTPVSVI